MCVRYFLSHRTTPEFRQCGIWIQFLSNLGVSEDSQAWKQPPNDVEHIHFLFKKDGKTFFSPTWWCISIRWLCWGNILVRDSGGFGGLNITWHPQAHMFGFLTPNWQCCLGRSWQDGALQREGGHQEWAFAFGDWAPLPVCSLIPNCEHILTNCPPHYSCQTFLAMLNFIPLNCKPPNTAFLP